MATQTRSRPQRPARTIVESAPALREMQEHDAAVNALPPAVQPSDIKAAVEVENGQPTGITLFLPAPVEVPTEGYVKRFNNIDCRLTEEGHKAAFQTLYYTLNQTHVQLACGKHIDNPSDVVKYLLEQFTLSLSGS